MLQGLSGSFLMFPESLFVISTRQYTGLSYFSFQVARLWNCYTSGSECKSVGNILGNHFVQGYSSLCILNDVGSITKAPSLQCSFQWREQVKNQLDLGQVNMGSAPVLSRLNPWPRATGVLEHCREGETSCCFFIFRGVSFLPQP